MTTDKRAESLPAISVVNPEGIRKIVVVEGVGYYSSTGKNSGLPGVWFPFISFHEPSYTYHPSPTKAFPFNPVIDYEAVGGYIYKVTKENVDKDLAKDDLLAEYKGGNPELTEALSRITLKSALVNCLRLMHGATEKSRLLSAFTDDFLSELGLSAEQISLSKIPLLTQEPEKKLALTEFRNDTPYEANKWMIEHGVKCIKQNAKVEFKLADLSLLKEKRKSPLQEITQAAKKNKLGGSE